MSLSGLSALRRKGWSCSSPLRFLKARCMLYLLLFARYHDFFMCLETICTRYGLDTELTPTSLVQNMHLQVLRIMFFAWSRLFTVITLRRPCEWIEKHEGILPVTRSSTKHCWHHLVFFWLHEETIEVVRAVFWGRNRNRCEICWTPSTLLYAFMILYASRIALVYQVYHSKK